MARWVAVFPLLAVIAVGCGGSRDPGVQRGGLQVVATTNLVADLVATVGGDRVEVVALMGPGVDPHLYKASEGDLRRITGARVVAYHGLHLEARMAGVFGRLRGRQRAVAVTAGIPAERLLAAEQGGGMPDPHVWFDPELWCLAAHHVAEVLADVDREGAQGYRSRARDMEAAAGTLLVELRRQVDTIPPEQRILVTAHDAFGYFGRAFGFEVHGLQGISTASEAGAADVQALASFVIERRVPALFVESSISPRTIQAVQAAVRARGVDVAIGGELYADALGAPGTPAGTWAGMLRHNVATIVAALTRQEGPGL